MNQLEMFTTLVDAAKQMPENRHLIRAIKLAEKKIDRLREKAIYRDGYRLMRLAKAQCLKCGAILNDCTCWDEARNCWLHSPVRGNASTSFIPAYFENVRN